LCCFGAEFKGIVTTFQPLQLQRHLVRLLAIWKQMVNGAHRYVSGLLSTMATANEQIFSLFATAQ
jgi:hypothetical protein